jgi:hypothetical protein
MFEIKFNSTFIGIKYHEDITVMSPSLYYEDSIFTIYYSIPGCKREGDFTPLSHLSDTLTAAVPWGRIISAQQPEDFPPHLFVILFFIWAMFAFIITAISSSLVILFSKHKPSFFIYIVVNPFY